MTRRVIADYISLVDRHVAIVCLDFTESLESWKLSGLAAWFACRVAIVKVIGRPSAGINLKSFFHEIVKIQCPHLLAGPTECPEVQSTRNLRAVA